MQGLRDTIVLRLHGTGSQRENAGPPFAWWTGLRPCFEGTDTQAGEIVNRSIDYDAGYRRAIEDAAAAIEDLRSHFIFGTEAWKTASMSLDAMRTLASLTPPARVEAATKGYYVAPDPDGSRARAVSERFGMSPEPASVSIVSPPQVCLVCGHDSQHCDAMQAKRAACAHLNCSAGDRRCLDCGVIVGYESAKPAACKRCGGDGYYHDDPLGYVDKTTPCPDCKGGA
jgi:hypothetical protein